MVLDTCSLQLLQARLLSGLDTCLFPSELNNALKSFLIACKVEGKTASTLASYRQRLRGFILFLDETGLPMTFAELIPNHIRLYILARQEKGTHASTINTEYRALKRFFTWCIGEGLAEKSPMVNIKPPRVPETEPQPLTHEQVATLLLTQSPRRSTFLSMRNTALILLFTDTGLRLSEMAHIQLSDFDGQVGQIKVMGKGNRVRVVQMGNRTLKALLMYLLSRTDNFSCMWVTEERIPLTRNGLRTVLRRLFSLAEIKGVICGAHVFRHTFAMESFLNGAREFEVQLLLGHKTLSMTRRYMRKLDSTHAAAAHHKFSPVDCLNITKSKY